MSNMPASVGQVHRALVPIVFTAHARWQLAVQLFGTPDRVKLLYGVADYLFSQVKETLFADVVLKLCQLTDPAQTNRHKNLSLYRLRDEVKAAESGLAAKLNLDATLKSANVSFKNIRAIRNRLIAHRDWRSPEPPKPVTNKAEIDQALELSSEIMNAVHRHYDNTTSNYYPYPGSPDGDRLIAYLQRCAKVLGSEVNTPSSLT
jgi:hypothetical protein